MFKTIFATLLLCVLFSLDGFAQCLTPLSPPDCTGTEPLVTDGDIVAGGTTKWYYGATATLNSVTIDGGTLVVCGNLTIDKFYITTGKIFIRPGGRLVIGSGIGSGLQFKGDCAIYNYGTCEIQRNLSLENPASVTTPNIIMNVLSSSVFLMSNQYFVINNAYSWFVNNGRAEFWGIITDQQSVAGSVCLGNASTTKMAILINKTANTYTVPNGNACVNVLQQSEFYGQLTANATLLACLGSSHVSSTSCIPFGCHPNYWGAAQVFTNCSGCAALMIALPVGFISFNAAANENGSNRLEWKTSDKMNDGVFTILHSTDGETFMPFDSISVNKSNLNNTDFTFFDQYPLQKMNYYMIRYTNIQTGTSFNSKIVKIISKIKTGFNLYPVPFYDKFFINYERGTTPQKVLLKDVLGRNIPIRYKLNPSSFTIEVMALDKLQPGLYIIHLQTDKSMIARPTMKY